MTGRASRGRLTAAALRGGVLIPFLYFGKQLVAAAFHPGYSFANQDASTLGSRDAGGYPLIFNVGSVVVGVMSVFAAWGFLRASRRLPVNPALAGLTALALASFGLGGINAGLHPLPDPRHSAGPLAIAGGGGIFLPLLIPAALWGQLRHRRWTRALLVANAVLLLAMIPVFSGLVQVVLVKAGAEWPAYQRLLDDYHGLLQRAAALVVVGAIGAGSYVLAGHAAGPPREALTG